MSKPAFKRMVLGMHHEAPDAESLRKVAELAAILNVPLLGLCAEDPGLIGVAALPFVRELRTLGGGWRALDADQLRRDVKLATEHLERRFAKAVRDLAIDASFRVVEGSPSHMITTISEAGDIVVVAESANPVERATHQSAALIEAAFQSEAAVLLLPHRIARRVGPIVAVAAAAGDPAIRAAAGIAAAVGEKLILVASDHAVHDWSAQGELSAADLAVERLEPKIVHLADASGICSALEHVSERLVVMTRGAFDAAVPAMVAAIRHIPVLIVELPHE